MPKRYSPENGSDQNPDYGTAEKSESYKKALASSRRKLAVEDELKKRLGLPDHDPSIFEKPDSTDPQPNLFDQ